MKQLFACLAGLLLLTGCGTVPKNTSTVYAMDTLMTLTVYGKNREAAEVSGVREIHRLDMLLSTTLEGSDIYRINREGSTVVSRETGLLLQRALEIAQMTGGDFDPTVYPLMRAWGFASEEGEHSYRVPDNMESLLSLVGYEKLRLQELTQGEQAGAFQATLPVAGASGLDLGGIAKGYTSQRVLEVIQAAGADTAVISLGGNVGVMGTKPDGSPWTVAIRDPEGEESDYMATLSLEGQTQPRYVVTSGGYERYFEAEGVRYHHILDPKTGYPADSDLLSVTIVAQDGTLADGLSTALFVKGFEEAVAFWQAHREEFDMVLITQEGIFSTPGLTISAQEPVTVLEAPS